MAWMESVFLVYGVFDGVLVCLLGLPLGLESLGSGVSELQSPTALMTNH